MLGDVDGLIPPAELVQHADVAAGEAVHVDVELVVLAIREALFGVAKCLMDLVGRDQHADEVVIRTSRLLVGVALHCYP